MKHTLDAESVILPGEDPAAYQALVDAYHRDWDPETPNETFHVETMVRSDWTRARLRRVEASLQRTLLAESSGDLAAALLSDSPAAKLLARVQRQIASLERAWNRANSELRRAYREQDDSRDQALEHQLANIDRGLASFPLIVPSAPSPRQDRDRVTATCSELSVPLDAQFPSRLASSGPSSGFGCSFVLP
jgi:hypothetical protein